MASRGRVLLGAALLFLVAGFFVPVPIPHISLPAERVFSVAGFPITNSILAAWLTMLILIVLSWRATRDPQLVPRGVQNLLEMGIEWFLGMVEGVAGKKNGRRFFPLVMTIFLFILVCNWLSLFPSFETIGLVRHAEPGQHAQKFQAVQLGPIPLAFVSTDPAAAEERGKPAEGAKPGEGARKAEGVLEGDYVPLLRAANTDLNTTLGLAIVAMIMVQFWGFRSLGFRGYGGKFLTLQGAPIGTIVGVMELISEFGKIISLTFRLFGNIFAGHVLLAVIGFLVPWVAVLPFLGLELFIGFIQAAIFAILTLIFATVAVASHAEHEHGPPGESVSD